MLAPLPAHARVVEYWRGSGGGRVRFNLRGVSHGDSIVDVTGCG